MGSKQQEVDVMSLPVQQLKALHDQLTQETEILTNSLQSLKAAQSQFVDSQDSLVSLNPKNKGKEMMVPLSGALYIPGKLEDVENVFVDIGTGYYVEKNIKEANEFFKRKIDFLQQKMKTLQPIVQQKYKNKQLIYEVLQAKVSMQQKAMVKS